MSGLGARDIGEQIAQTDHVSVNTGAKYFGGSGNRRSFRLSSKDKQVLIVVAGVSLVAYFAFKYAGRK